MPKLLITGSGGFLGWNLCQIAHENWKVVGLYRQHASNLPSVDEHQVDLKDFSKAETTVSSIKPDAIIHTAAFSNNNALQKDPAQGFLVNVEVSEMLAGQAAAMGIPFIFTSTDLVFDGREGMYREDDEVNPITHYGEQKAEAEERIMEVNDSACICRMPLMLGPAGTPNASFLQDFVEKTGNGIAYPLFEDEFRTPVGVRSAAAGLLLAIQENWQGIFHLGGMERLNRVEIGKHIIEALDLGDAKINPCQHKDVQLAAPRQKDATLNSEKAYRRGFKPQLLYKELKELKPIIL